MKSKKPIVYILGVPGHFYLAEAVAKEFDRPVIGITSYGRIEEKITPEVRAHFQEIHSLPDFYFARKDKLESLSEKDFSTLFRTFEEKLGIDDNTMLAQYDRALRWTPDFKRIRVFQLAVMQFVDKFLTDIEPAFCIDGVATYLQLALRKACTKNNIPYLLTQNSRLNGHFNMIHTNGQHVGMRDVFDDLQKGGQRYIDDETIKKADTHFYEFINKPVRPAYAERNSVLKINPAKMARNLLETLQSDKLFPSEKIKNFDRALGYESSPLLYLWNGVKGKYRRAEQKIKKIFDDAPDMNVPFIYLPLHYMPEISDMYFGSACDHHAGFVAQFSKHIPSDCQLYVKEHTSMMGQRPTSFYDDLGSIYNVKMVAPSVGTFELTKNAQCVAAVTGTAGWEAFLLGKPVIALGNVFYNSLPGVYNASVNDDFAAGLTAYMKDFKPNEQERLNAFRAFYVTCGVSTKGDIGYEIIEDQARNNAEVFARSLKKYIEEWGHTLDGNFDADFLTTPKKVSA